MTKPAVSESIAAYDAQAADWAAYQDSGKNLAQRFIEKPAMLAVLPPIKGKSVLCVGCGSGEELALLQRHKPTKLLGIDASPGMIEQARKRFPGYDFQVGDMAQLDVKTASCDFVYSSMTIHYAQDWVPALNEWQRVLKKNGEILLSAPHPAYYNGERRSRGLLGAVRLLGYKENRLWRRNRIYGNYFDRAERRLTHRAHGKVVNLINYNPTVSAMLQMIRAADLEILDCIEPQPSREAHLEYPLWAKLHERVPIFILFRLKKGSR